jgi:PAS domain S-box-containing protein
MLKTNRPMHVRTATRTTYPVLVVFAGLLLTLLVIISYTFLQAKQVQLNHDAYVALALQELRLIDELEDSDEDIHKALLLHLTTSDPAEKNAYERGLRAAQRRSTAVIRQLKQLIQHQEDREILLHFEQSLAQHNEAINHLMYLSRQGNTAAALSFNRATITLAYREHQTQLKKLSNSISESTRESGRLASASVSGIVENHRYLVAIILLVSLTAALLLRHIIRRLRHDNQQLNLEVDKRQTLQQAFQDSQTRYKMLFDLNPMPMWVYDQLTRHFVDVNEAALREYGYSREEFLKLNIFDIRPKQDVAPLKQKLEQQDKQDSQHSTARHKRKDGSEFEVEAISHALPSLGDWMPRLVISINVDERVSMIEQLQKSEHQLREISSSIPGAVFQLEMSGKNKFAFTFISEGISTLFQVTPQEVYANAASLYRHIAPADLQHVHGSMLQAYRQTKPLRVVFRIAQPDNDGWRWVQTHGLPTVKNDGTVVWNGTLIDITEQRRARERLTTSEANLRALLDSSPQAIFLLDSERKIVMFNSVAKSDAHSFLLIDLEKGTDFLDLVCNEKKAQFIGYHRRAMQGETILYEEGQGEYWHEIALRPVLAPDNRVLAVAVSTLDISERKRNLEAIKRSEEQLARAQQLALLGNWEHDLLRDQLTWSDSVYEIYGVSKASFMPTRQSMLRFVPEDEREPLLAAYQTAATTGKLLEMEHSIIRPDGKTRIVHEIGEPEYDEQGQLVCFKGSVQDITLRKQTEQEALKAKNLLQTTLANIPEIIFSADTHLNMLYVSPQCLELTGYTEDQFVEQPDLWSTIVHPEDRAFVEQGILPNLHKGERQHYEVRITTQDGQQKWMMLRVSPRRGYSGKVYRLDGSISDMTSYKEAQQKRDELTDQLLKQNQNLQQFAYIVSHNLRAPIANILGLTTIYNKHKPDSPMNPKVIDNLFKSAKLLDTTIRDLNEILTIRSELNSVREEVSFGQVTEEILDGLQTDILGPDVQIVQDFANAPTVLTVRSYLYSILHNLITNALKYRSYERNLQLHLKTFTIPNYICMSITDNGLGIDLSREKEKVFGLYNRFHAHTEGRGLGLHLVKTQTELLGGKVEVESKVNVGTTFNIYFRHTL